MNAKITAIGSYLPEKVLTNHDLETMVETNDEWIVKRTGIKERRIIGDNQTMTDMCEQALLNMKERYQKDLSDVDFILLATSTEDHSIPTISSQVQARLGIKNAGTLDITAACAGFVYGLIVAEGLIKAGSAKKVLVFGSDILSKYTDYTDRATCILFGDGAGAVLVEATEEKTFYGSVTGTEGEAGDAVYMSDTCNKISGVEIINNKKIHQDGKRVFKWAVSRMSEQSEKLLEKSNLSVADLDYFVPHNANQRIIEAICRGIKFPVENAISSIAETGNTSAASIPLAIDKAIQDGVDLKDKKMLLIGFGSGLTYAGIILDWVI